MTLGLTILGGAAAWPNPGQGCSAYLVTSDDTRLLLDCGADTFLALREHTDYHALDAVVISHCHADHMLDLVPFRYGLKYGPDPVNRRTPLWLPPGGIERLDALANALAYGSEDSSGFWSDVFDVHEYEPERNLHLNGVTIEFAPTQHFVPCYAMRVNHPNGTAIGYSADTGAIEPLIAAMTGTSLLLVEATERDHGEIALEDRGHLTPQDAGRLATECGVETLLLTHVWSERADDEVIAAAALTFAGRIAVAKPGMHVGL